jgi:hypothetical protein
MPTVGFFLILREAKSAKLLRKLNGCRTSQGDSVVRDFSVAEAERILSEGMKTLELSEAEIRKPEYGDLRRSAIGWVIWHRTSGVSHAWIAERLNMKSAANSSQQIRKFGRLASRAMDSKIRNWIKKNGKW